MTRWDNRFERSVDLQEISGCAGIVNSQVLLSSWLTLAGLYNTGSINV